MRVNIEPLRDDVLATKIEGDQWVNFTRIIFTTDKTFHEKMEELRLQGFKIFIDLNTELLYDDISGTIHTFKGFDVGREDIVGRYYLDGVKICKR